MVGQVVTVRNEGREPWTPTAVVKEVVTKSVYEAQVAKMNSVHGNAAPVTLWACTCHPSPPGSAGLFRIT
jgi:hypothetical protein